VRFHGWFVSVVGRVGFGSAYSCMLDSMGIQGSMRRPHLIPLKNLQGESKSLRPHNDGREPKENAVPDCHLDPEPSKKARSALWPMSRRVLQCALWLLLDDHFAVAPFTCKIAKPAVPILQHRPSKPKRQRGSRHLGPAQEKAGGRRKFNPEARVTISSQLGGRLED